MSDAVSSMLKEHYRPEIDALKEKSTEVLLELYSLGFWGLNKHEDYCKYNGSYVIEKIEDIVYERDEKLQNFYFNIEELKKKIIERKRELLKTKE